jgi:hypothetical protein
MAEHDDEGTNEAPGRDTLDAWRADPPPPGFADRVLAARRAEQARGADESPRAPRRLGRMAAVAVGVCAVGAAVLLAWPRGRAANGSLVATERTSFALDGRGIAVAEPGAELAWRVTGGGDARVDQRAGDVFYRVDPGGPFVVETSLGRVEVKGTCFRVEVIPMSPSKPALIGAGVGAALSAAVVITVYEGKVLLANPQGERTVAAGERGVLTDGAAPSVAADGKAIVVHGKPSPVEEVPAPSAGATREELLERDRIQREELARLRVRVRDLEGVIAEGPQVRRRGGGVDAPFVDPTPEQLLDMARTCQVQWDSIPLAIGEELGPKQAASLGITEEERVALNKVRTSLTERVVAQLRQLYVEVTGDAATAETLGADTLAREIQDKSPRRDLEEATWRISQERAGLLAPPADLASRPPVERAVRLLVSVGDQFEHELAAAIGKDRAHELRKADDGWPMRSITNGCPDDRPSLAPPAGGGAPPAPAQP